MLPLAAVRADVQKPGDNDRYIAKAVSFLLRHQHLSKHALDDEISERAFDLYLKTLDPAKLYFNQSDVAEFLPSKHVLDDQVREGNLTFAYTVFRRFLARVDERMQFITDAIRMDHDFTIDEEIVVDRDAAQYARNEAEARELWRKRIKYEILLQKSEGKKLDEIRDSLLRRFQSYAKRMHQTDSDEVLEMYLSSLTRAFDPHTEYMAPSTLENFDISMRLELDGIGAALQTKDGLCTVARIIPGGPADRDGRLKTEDKVVAVGQGEEGELVDVSEMKLNDVVHLIRGKRGTVVRLKVVPAAGGEPRVYSLTRDRIELKESEARGEIIEEAPKHGASPIKVGVIDLPSFYLDMEGERLNLPNYKSSTRDVQKILADFRRQNVDVVVIDLRRNGGGSLVEAISLTGLFIDRGPVVQVKDSDGRVDAHEDEEKGVAWAGPLVVLTSRLSASASEIFAGAIQDYGRGIVVGDPSTHGKGTVQSLLDLSRQLFRVNDAPKLGALKLTMQQFYRPGGDSTQERGVLADVVLPSLISHWDVGESDLEFALKFDRVEKADFVQLGHVNPAMIEALRKQSAARVSRSPDFQRVERNIARYKEQKARKTVTLNEEKYIAERKEIDDESKSILDEDDPNPNSAVVKRDYYFNEALAITLDYVQLLSTAGGAGGK
jgi:carboxyl-terminal processing protease